MNAGQIEGLIIAIVAISAFVIVKYTQHKRNDNRKDKR